MSFAINPSLTHIDLPESQILEIYRSKGAIQLSDARFRGHPCEAVICIAKIDKIVTARVALLETVMNSIFVYTSDFFAEQSSDYPKVLKEAEEFTTSFGFSMEKVNLEFSPAMREVIVKGIRVMRQPLKKPKLRSHNAPGHSEQHSPEPQLSTPPPVPESTVEATDPAEIRQLTTDLASARTFIEKITREKRAFEESATREIASLKAAAEKATQSAVVAVNEQAQILETERGEKLATVRQHAEQIKQLKAALDKAVTLEKNLRDEISRLSAASELSEKEILHWKKELSKEKSISAGEISKLTAEIAAINELLAVEKNAVTNKNAELAHLETSLRESQQREEDLCRNLDIMKEQLDQRDAELENLHRQAGREEALLLKIASLEKEATAAREAMEQRAENITDQTAREAELKSLVEARNDVEVEYIRMANEALQKENEMLEALYSADAEIVRLSRELDLSQQTAETEKAALRDEVQRLMHAVAATPAGDTPSKASTSTAPAPAPLPTPPDLQTGPPGNNALTAEPVPPAPASKAGTPAVSPAFKSVAELDTAEDAIPDEIIIAEEEITKGLLNEYGSFCGSSGHTATEFTIDPDLRSIDYADPAEILAILFSNNSVHAVPDGSSVQRCKGYVVALKQSAHYLVYLAWFMPESEKVVICTPEHQPADAAECTQLIQDAVAYFEIVGFMMEVAELGNTVKSYLRAIKKVPALRRT